MPLEDIHPTLTFSVDGCSLTYMGCGHTVYMLQPVHRGSTRADQAALARRHFCVSRVHGTPVGTGGRRAKASAIA
jgi:hypothetical protein